MVELEGSEVNETLCQAWVLSKWTRGLLDNPQPGTHLTCPALMTDIKLVGVTYKHTYGCMYVCVCLYVRMHVDNVYLYMCILVTGCVHSFIVSVCLSVCLCLLVCLSICMSVCVFVCLSVSLFVCLSLCFSVCLSLCFSICLSVCLSVGGCYSEPPN